MHGLGHNLHAERHHWIVLHVCNNWQCLDLKCNKNVQKTQCQISMKLYLITKTNSLTPNSPHKEEEEEEETQTDLM